MSLHTLHSESSDDNSEQLWISPKLSRESTQPQKTPSPEAPLSKQKPEARQVHSAVEGKRRRPGRRATQLEPRLSAVQTAAWVVPRVMVLFALGWAWSTGVQFIHAQQTGRRLPSGLFGDYDSSDSEDSDDFVRQGVTRDVLARVLGSAQWANGVSGVLTVV
ncbi:hypothetical protein IWW36_003614, partial [Coemansia brasiliensis]